MKLFLLALHSLSAVAWLDLLSVLCQSYSLHISNTQSDAAINILLLISYLAPAMSICTLDLDVLMMEDPWLSTLVRHLC